MVAQLGGGHHNPFLDTQKYDVEIDGIPHEYAANTIAENLYSQVDSEGRHQLIFHEIIDDRKNDEAIPIAQGTIKDSWWSESPNNYNQGLEAQGCMGIWYGIMVANV